MPGVVSEADRHEARRRWLTTAQAGELIGGVTSEQVRLLIKDGMLTALDVSRKNAKAREYRIRQDWIDAYIVEHIVATEEVPA
jgi:ribosomal protein L19E